MFLSSAVGDPELTSCQWVSFTSGIAVTQMNALTQLLPKVWLALVVKSGRGSGIDGGGGSGGTSNKVYKQIY